MTCAAEAIPHDPIWFDEPEKLLDKNSGAPLYWVQNLIDALADQGVIHLSEDCASNDWPDEITRAALQKMHEIMHPNGTVSIAYCRDRPCFDLVSVE
jgi:hypothetical protein